MVNVMVHFVAVVCIIGLPIKSLRENCVKLANCWLRRPMDTLLRI